MHAAESQPALELNAFVAPGLLAERRGNRIAVEHRQNERIKRLERFAAIGLMRSEHTLDQLSHHGEAERKRAPARLLDGIDEGLLAKQHLGIMSSAGA